MNQGDKEEHTHIKNEAEAVAGENVANNQGPAVEGTTDATPIHVASGPYSRSGIPIRNTFRTYKLQSC
jgi:hypothetical protein